MIWRRNTSRSLVAIVSLSAGLEFGTPARADEAAYTLTEETIVTEDGVPLHAYVFRPAASQPDGKTPVVLDVGPYHGSGGWLVGPTPTNTALPSPNPELIARGYSYVMVSFRGTGASGGCFDYGGAGEQEDVRASVEWAASRSWSTGKVAVQGTSYDGWAGLMALATKPEGLAAVVAKSPTNGYDNSFMNGVRTINAGQPIAYSGSDLYPPSLLDDPEAHRSALEGSAQDPTCYATTPVFSFVETDLESDFWQERDLMARIDGTEIPTLLVHGFFDYRVRPNAFVRIWKSLAGPKRAWFGPWSHAIPGGDRPGGFFSGVVLDWYDTHLKGEDPRDAPRVEVQSRDGTWRAEEDWPPADATPFEVPLLHGTYLDAPGNFSEVDGPDDTFPESPAPPPTGFGSWTFTQPFAHDVHVAGAPVLDAEVEIIASGATLIALVYDVDPEGNARFLERGAFRIEESGLVRFELCPQDHVIRAGHRLGVLLTGSDTLWFLPESSFQPVSIVRARLEIPALRFGRTEALPDGIFSPSRLSRPFQVDEATIESRTSPAPLPPPLEQDGP